MYIVTTDSVLLVSRREKMNKKSFTLVEILIVLVIVSILASFSIVNYQKTVEAQKDKVCQQNLKVLQAAIDIYALENNALPLSLSQITQEQIYLAHQKVLGSQKENILLCLLRDIFGAKSAQAAGTGITPFGRYYGNDKKVFLCPSDPDYKNKLANINSLTDKDFSYEFDDDENKFLELDTKELKEDDSLILFQDKGPWHKEGLFGKKYSNGIAPSGKPKIIPVTSASHPI
jgi:prepilin-type N-terminal cleavage/methylation domain-containing protein